MLNKMTLTTVLAAVILMGLSFCCCNTATAQVSDAQIWDVQTPNSYAGGARGNEGFFFGAEGLYWALPSPKSALVGNESAEGENAYSIGWTVINSSTKFFVINDKGDDEDDDDDDDDDDSDSEDSNNNSGDGIQGTIIKASSSGSSSGSGIKEALQDGFTEVSVGEFIDYAADRYGPIGQLRQAVQHNDWNTNMLDTKFHVGQRYTFGFMNGHHGWDCSIFTIDGQTEKTGRSVEVGFEDTNNGADGKGNNYLGGIIYREQKKDHWVDCTQDDNGNLLVDRMLVQFDTARMWSDISTWGIELNYLHRSHATRAGIFELGLGMRYMKWDEEFGFWGGSPRGGNGEFYAPNFLDDTSIETTADNNMFGPQLGLRWNRQKGRFGMELLGKFTAAYNAQKISNYSIIGSNAYANGIYGSDSVYGLGIDNGEEGEEESGDGKWVVYDSNIGAGGESGYHKMTDDLFTPIVEVGVKFNIDLTTKVQLSLGWSGIYAGNIARPAGMVDYTLDMAGNGVMGLVDGNNKNDVFMHGFVFGLTLNR